MRSLFHVFCFSIRIGIRQDNLEVADSESTGCVKYSHSLSDPVIKAALLGS